QEKVELFLDVAAEPSSDYVEAEQQHVDHQADAQRHVVQGEQPAHRIVARAQQLVGRIDGEVERNHREQAADDQIDELEGLDLENAVLDAVQPDAEQRDQQRGEQRDEDRGDD